MDGKWSSMCGGHPTDAHVRSAGSGMLDVRPQLRSPKRHGDIGFVESGLEKLHIQARPGGATDRRILQMLC